MRKATRDAANPIDSVAMAIEYMAEESPDLWPALIRFAIK